MPPVTREGLWEAKLSALYAPLIVAVANMAVLYRLDYMESMERTIVWWWRWLWEDLHDFILKKNHVTVGQLYLCLASLDYTETMPLKFNRIHSSECFTLEDCIDK